MEFFTDYPVLARISSRKDGSCRLNLEEKDSLENRRKFFGNSGIDPASVAAAMLVHGNKIAYTDEGGLFQETDGLITDRPGVFLSITVADCLPIFIYEPEMRMVGLLHAGWRGLRNGIIQEGVSAMSARGGSPDKMLAAVGPSIGPCHFEVKGDVLKEFGSYPEAVSARGGRVFLDLRLIARSMLQNAGLSPEKISAEAPCTACSPEYFSWRRDKPPRLEAMVAVIGLKPL